MYKTIEFRGVRYKWAAGDDKLPGDLHTIDDLEEHVYPRLKSCRSAVQAGGAMGVWAAHMSKKFDYVYTFEPTPESFHCLTVNAPQLNVFKFNAALGCVRGLVGVEPERPRNYGSNHIVGQGRTPLMLIDDLCLEDCDLIMLDIEGYEYQALRGAVQTIERCAPAIVLEDKGCSQRYGYERGDCERFLQSLGYTESHRFHGGRDVICLKS